MTDLPSEDVENIMKHMGESVGEMDEIFESISGKKKKKNSYVESYCTNINNLALDGKIDPLVGRDPLDLGKRKGNRTQAATHPLFR